VDNGSRSAVLRGPATARRHHRIVTYGNNPAQKFSAGEIIHLTVTRHEHAARSSETGR
jgi:hypothetical protein